LTLCLPAKAFDWNPLNWSWISGANASASSWFFIPTPAAPGGWSDDYSLLFGGTDEYLQAADHASLDITGEITVAAWVKVPSGHTDIQSIVAKWLSGTGGDEASYRVILWDDGAYKFSFTIDEEGDGAPLTAYKSTSAINDGKYHFLVGTYVAGVSVEGTFALYTDGNDESTFHNRYGGGAKDINVSTAPLYIGAEEHDEAMTWHAVDTNIAEVYIWNSALSQAEVTALFNAGKSVDPRSDFGNYVSSANLVAYPSMGDGPSDSISTIYDLSTNSNDFTPSGMEGSDLKVDAPGTWSNIASFGPDGTNETVIIPDAAALDITDKISVSFWIYIDDTSAHQGILGKAVAGTEDSFIVYWNNAGGLYWRHSDTGDVNTSSTTAVSDVAISDDTWTHVAITADGNVVKMYFNSVLDGSMTYNSQDASTIYSSTSDLEIGDSFEDSDWFPLDGFIDEVEIFDTAILTQANVTAIFNAGTALDTTDLSLAGTRVGLWRFESGSHSSNADAVLDETANDLDGTGENIEVGDLPDFAEAS